MSGNLPFVDIKFSNKHHAACCSRALLATLSRFLFLWGFCGLKNANASYILEALALKWEKCFMETCLRGPSKRVFKCRIGQHC